MAGMPLKSIHWPRLRCRLSRLRRSLAGIIPRMTMASGWMRLTISFRTSFCFV